MKKYLLTRLLALGAGIFPFFGLQAQQIGSNGDLIIPAHKQIQNTVMAYTPCPSLTSTITVKNQINCSSVTNGSANIVAGGGVPSYYYSWFGPRTYEPISLPTFGSNYSASQARGIWFTSPTNTVITGLKVPTDVGTANQFVYVVRYLATPPTFPTENNNYVVLGRFLDVSGTDTIKCGIAINTGDIIGILGVRGSTASSTANMSYGSGGFVTSISGFTTTLYRFMSQTDITTQNLGNLCEGGTGSIGRVEVYFGNAISLTQNATNLLPGNYSTFYTDTNGCMKTSTLSIAPGATITGVTSFTNPSCVLGNDGKASVVASGGFNPYTYSWTPSGGNAALATGLSTGTYSCLITDSLGNCATSTVTLGICSGVNQLKEKITSIYPNPNTGKFLIDISYASEMEIYNALGEPIMKQQLVSGKNPIDLKLYTDGIYYVRIKKDNNWEYFKLIKN